MPPTDPRDSGQWRRLRKKLREQATHCAICGGPLRTGAPRNSPWETTIDHIVPLSRGGAPFDTDNLRAAHRGCNGRKGDRSTAPRRRPAEPVNTARGTRSAWWGDIP